MINDTDKDPRLTFSSAHLLYCPNIAHWNIQGYERLPQQVNQVLKGTRLQRQNATFPRRKLLSIAVGRGARWIRRSESRLTGRFLTCSSLADQWATKGRYYNCCGPTETTIVNTMSRHVTGQTLSIGVPTPNNSIYILDEQGSVVTSGSIGFIWAGGLGVSRGYVGLDEKTREVYVPDTFAKDG